MGNISSFTKDLRLTHCPSLQVLAPGPPSFTRRSLSSTKVSGGRTMRFGRRYRRRLGRTSSSRKTSRSLSRMISSDSSIARTSTRIWLFLGRCAITQCCRFVGLTPFIERSCAYLIMTCCMAKPILMQDLLRPCWKRKDRASMSKQLPRRYLSLSQISLRAAMKGTDNPVLYVRSLQSKQVFIHSIARG